MRIVIALAVALIAANHVSLVQADERSEIADRVYKSVMGWMQEYQQIYKTKTMVICIDWDAPTASGFRVHSAFSASTAEQSGASIFPGKLVQDAKSNCKQWRKSENVDCTCQKLDNTGKNVLKVPASELGMSGSADTSFPEPKSSAEMPTTANTPASELGMSGSADTSLPEPKSSAELHDDTEYCIGDAFDQYHSNTLRPWNKVPCS